MATTGKPSLCRRSPKLSVSSPPIGISQELQVAQHVRREVAQTLVFRVARPFQKAGNVLGLDLAGIRAAGMQEGAAGAVDRAHLVFVEIDEVRFVALGVFRVQIEQSAPTAADAHHLVPFVNCAIHHRLDTGVQAGYITTTGQNANFHCVPPKKCQIKLTNTQLTMRRIFAKVVADWCRHRSIAHAWRGVIEAHR
jgi:hypothetical protein